MKQYEAVIQVMEENGGYATLGHLYGETLKVPNCKWNTKTPFASIRRIVQDERFFFKIKPGLWALKEWKEKLPEELLPTGEQKKKDAETFNHTYYQGLLVEIGNLKKLDTYVPPQDKNRLFLTKKLGELATMDKLHSFSHDNITRKAKTIDVIWFNNRKMPDSLFEVEYTTNFQNSLLKFVELQDFNSRMYIVSDVARKKEFEGKMRLDAFNPIRKRVGFMDYDRLSSWHAKMWELVMVEGGIYL